MEIVSPGIKEGTLYRITSRSSIDGKISYACGIARGAVYGMRIDIMGILGDPKIPSSEVDSVIRGMRRFDVYEQWPDDLLDKLIDEAARSFSKDAAIGTLDESFFIKSYEKFGCKRYHPVPKGILQYFRKELRKRRQKLIEEID